MNRLTSYILVLLSAAAVITGCSHGTATKTGAGGTASRGIVVPPISHNDSMRFKIFYFEAVKQQVAGNYDAAYDLLSHCLDINPNAAEAYFMMSSYSGVLYGDTAALEDVKKAAELDPENNTYLEAMSPVGICWFLLKRSFTGPLTWITNSRPKRLARSQSSAFTSSLNTNWVIP